MVDDQMFIYLLLSEGYFYYFKLRAFNLKEAFIQLKGSLHSTTMALPSLLNEGFILTEMSIPAFCFPPTVPIFGLLHPLFTFSFILFPLSCLFTFCKYKFQHGYWLQWPLRVAATHSMAMKGMAYIRANLTT